MKYYLFTEQALLNPGGLCPGTTSHHLTEGATAVFTEDAILKDRHGVAAIEGQHFTFPIPKDEPTLPEVPLGPNVMKNGWKCRVICNDGVGPRPVLALAIPAGRKEEELFSYSAEGKTLTSGLSCYDLVGHLPPPRVPLGPNVTRGGRKARVLANDRFAKTGGEINNDSSCSVVALVVNEDGSEKIAFFGQDGRVSIHIETIDDLVGHLKD